MNSEDVSSKFDDFLLNFCYGFKNNDDSKVGVENIVFYIFIRRALNDGGLWKDGREKLKDEILDQVISEQKNKLSIMKNDKSKKLLKNFKKINFRDIKITKDEFNYAVNDIVEYIKFQIEGMSDWIKTYEKALERGDEAIKEIDIKNKREELENARTNLKNCDEEDKSEFEDWIKSLEKALKKDENKKVTQSKKECYKKNIEERKEIVEEREAKLKDIEKIKFEEVEELSKSLIIKD